ncbi:hypothetical protein K438DRAFT_2019113 [Mycena galopus ATCC 62051]|nr:hypothetical protein K438DRAFT_2019113 [Mycena galopus ATCC 62051]
MPSLFSRARAVSTPSKSKHKAPAPPSSPSPYNNGSRRPELSISTPVNEFGVAFAGQGGQFQAGFSTPTRPQALPRSSSLPRVSSEGGCGAVGFLPTTLPVDAHTPGPGVLSASTASVPRTMTPPPPSSAHPPHRDGSTGSSPPRATRCSASPTSRGSSPCCAGECVFGDVYRPGVYRERNKKVRGTRQVRRGGVHELAMALLWGLSRVVREPSDIHMATRATFRAKLLLAAHVDNAPEISASQSVQLLFNAALPYKHVAVISINGIQWKPDLLSLHREKPNVYVEISVGGKKLYHTSAKRNWEGMWNDISSLSADTESAKIGFPMFHKPTVGKHKCLAKTTREISVLLKESSVKGGLVDFQLELYHADEHLTQTSIVVCMSPAKGLADAAGPLAKATENSATLYTGSAGTMAGSAVELVNQGAQHDDLL